MKFLQLALTLLCIATSGGPSRVTLISLSKAAYMQAAKQVIVTKPHITFPVRKKDGRLVIPTAKGSKVFKDVVIDAAAVRNGHSESELTTYNYLGYIAELKSHLIQVQYYEIAQWLLIDAQGRQMELWGAPVFSPDLKRIAAVCEGIEYGGGQPNIIQLLELQNGVLREVWKLEPENWEPTRIGWTSATTLVLSKEMWTEKSQGNTFTYAKLVIK